MPASILYRGSKEVADGDPWSLDRKGAKYIQDDATIMRYMVLEKYYGQAALGWTDLTDNKIKTGPAGLKVRKWLLWDAGDHADRRRVTVATNTAYVAGTVDTTTIIVQNPSTDVEDTFTLYGMEGERWRSIHSG